MNKLQKEILKTNLTNKHFIYSSRSDDFIFEGQTYYILKYNANLSNKYIILSEKLYFNGSLKSLCNEQHKSTTLKDILHYELNDDNYSLYNIEINKTNFFNMKKKEILEYPNYIIMLYYCNEDIEFKIKMYEKNCIYNNQLFYDVFSSGRGYQVKYTIEQLKKLLNCKQFTSTTKILGGNQDQKHNAINHLLKTQDLTSDLFDIIFEKYKDDVQMKEDILRFILNSKKVDINKIKDAITNKVILDENIENLFHDLKQKISSEDVEDESLKLLLEVI